MAEIVIPREIPVMTLSNTVLFPHAMMPLYIFEPRYREMLAYVLDHERVFAIATVDQEKAADQNEEPPLPYASAGIIRACHQNEDGTANLILQGLCRIHINTIVREDPFRVVAIDAMETVSGTDQHTLLTQHTALRNSLKRLRQVDGETPDEIFEFLMKIDDPEIAYNLCAYTLCNEAEDKHQLLANPNLHSAYKHLLRLINDEIRQIKLERQLRGKLDLDDLGAN
jgi:Lon protease-like protein